MAKDIILKVVINGTEKEINSVKELNKAIKEAENELAKFIATGDSKGIAEAKKKIEELDGALGDLGDTAKTTKGSGVEQLNSSIGLLGESLTNFDGGKFKIAMQGIGQAMSAIPVFLIIEGIKLLIENFDKVADFAKVFFGVMSEGEKEIKALNAEVKKQTELTTQLSKELGREIALLEAQGASSSKILELKKQLIHQQIQEAIATAKLNIAKAKEIQNNDSLTESLLRKNAEALRAIGLDEKAAELEKTLAIEKYQRSKEAIDAAFASAELIKDLQNQEKVETIKVNKEIKKTADDRRKEEREAQEDLNKRQAEMLEKSLRELHNTIKLANFYHNQEINDQELKMTDDMLKGKKLIEDKYRQIKNEADAKDAEERRIRILKEVSEDLVIANNYAATINNLNDLVFSIKSNNLKKGSKEEEEAAKKQFQINKALQIVTAAINGAQSVTAILAVPDFTLGIASAARIAAATLATAATIAKISSTQFASTATASQGGVNTGSGSVFNVPLPPTTVASGNTTPVTTFSSDGTNQNFNQPVIKTYVTETDLTSSQNRINKIHRESTFG